MRRTVLLLAVVLLAVPLLGSDAPKEYDGAAAWDDGLQGTWRLTGHRINGEPRNPYDRHVQSFRSGTYTITWSDGDLWQGSYRIDSARNPPHLDWIPSGGGFKGEMLKFICKRDGDTLRIAGRRDKQRPPGFNDEGVEVWTYKRVK
jgi:uncharacterized protein (TIGR03067 family)